jgi:hypothetical protein
MTSRKVILRACLLFLVWRGIFFLSLLFGLSLSSEFAGHYAHPSEWNFLPEHYFLNGFFRWDAYWYELIAREGYGTVGDEANAVAFFPLYPILARVTGTLFGSHLLSGLLISNAAFLIGLIYLYRIGLTFYDQATVERAIIFFLCFPAAIFHSAFYTEGLYIALTAAFFHYFLRRQYGRATVGGALATLCRPTGLLVLIVAFLATAVRSLKSRSPPGRSFYVLLLVPLGLATHMAYLHVHTGDALAFAHVQAHWGRTAQFPLVPIAETLQSIDWAFPRDMRNTQNVINVVTSMAFLVAGIALLVWPRDSRSWPLFGIYVIGGTLFPLHAGLTDSAVRYCSVLFPAFFLLAEKVTSRIGEAVVVGAFSMLSVVYGLGFMNKFWVV